MKILKRLISYLINPRSGVWKFSDTNEINRSRKVPWKGIINPPLILGTILLTGLVIIIWFGPHLASYDPYITSRSIPSRYDPESNVVILPPFDPSPEFPLGTDLLGNDMLSLIIYGARTTLISCLYITVGRMILGLVLGGLSGWMEGDWFDRLIMRLSTVISSIPLLLSAMLMILALGIEKGIWVFVVSLSILGWTEISQQVRAEVIQIKGMPYILAAEALGMKRIQILAREVLPNIMPQLVSLSFLEMGSILLIMAELAFLDIYVGGVSTFGVSPYLPMMRYLPTLILIQKVPEWGALLAQGTKFLRGSPHMALGPTLAFFISILGLNAFGEGIRKIFFHWPISTAFLLKKRMLLIAAGFIGLTMIIFQMTNATVSYQKLAESIQEIRLTGIYEDLKTRDDFGRGGGENQLVAYVIERFEELGIEKGYSETVTSSYYYPAQATVVKPDGEPRLILSSGGDYLFQRDFAFLAEGCAGSGFAQGQITLFSGDLDALTPDEGRLMTGKIILALEDTYSSDFAQAAASMGVEGILVATRNQTPLNSQFEVSSDWATNLCPVDTIPVFKITEDAASAIMDQAHLDWEETSLQAVEQDFVLDLDLQAELDLSLTEPETVSVPNMIGFIGGYDMDHANEILVVYASFDGLGLTAYDQEAVPEADLVKIALLLEILNTWDEYQLDPRRSVQFVIWGGEGLVGPYSDMITGIMEKNRMAAIVPTKPIKPALWLEIRDLGLDTASLSFSDQSSDFLVTLLQKAARAGRVLISPGQSRELPDPIALPYLSLGEGIDPDFVEVGDISSFLPKGVVINRVLIQLTRDMEVGKSSLLVQNENR